MDVKRISALIASVVVAVNAIMAMTGLPQLSIDEELIYNVVSAVALVGTWGYTIWKNFPFTKEAKVGQAVIDDLKAKKKEQGQ